VTQDRANACYDAECWLAMMGSQLINGHLAITVPALAEPVDRSAALVP
jgi:hypothetical protein